MIDASKNRELAQQVFAITGVAVPEDDALVLAALFQAHSLEEAGRNAAEHIALAAQAVQVAADEATKAAARAEAVALHAANDRKAFAQTAAATQKALAKAIDGEIKKAVKEAGKVQSSENEPPQGWRGVLSGVALGIFITLGTMLVACNFRLSWFSDARVGAEWASIQPTLPADLRFRLMKHIEKLNR